MECNNNTILSVVQQWDEQASLDDNLRKTNMYLGYFQRRSELLKKFSRIAEKGESLNDIIRRIDAETRDFNKCLAETLDEK